MGGEKKEESGFGFKDKQKALETLELLQQHEPRYRALTVRGLLGRARRVLSMTKADEKVKNIKEAIAVFEEWTQQQKDTKSADKDTKSADKDAKSADKDAKSSDKEKQEKKKRDEGEEDDDMELDENNSIEEKKDPQKADTVPGLGFKDAAAARASLQALEGRDPNYQKLAVKGLLGRADRTLAVTRDETKKKNIKEAKEILEKYLEEWERRGRGGDNLDYLSLPVVLGCLKLAREKADVLTAQQERFIEAYRAAEGDYKRLRTVAVGGGGGDSRTWDIVRNATLAELKASAADEPLTEADGQPSAAHLKLALWAYSPAPDKLKRLAAGAGAKRAVSEHNAQHSPSKKTKH